MSMRWDYVSELLPPTGLVFISQVTYEHEEPVQNYIDRRKPINLSQRRFVRKSQADSPGTESRPPRWHADS
jgi:hypothetical protein